MSQVYIGYVVVVNKLGGVPSCTGGLDIAFPGAAIPRAVTKRSYTVSPRSQYWMDLISLDRNNPRYARERSIPGAG